MFVSKIMLDQLEHDMEKNNREMVIMPLENLRIEARQASLSLKQPPNLSKRVR